MFTDLFDRVISSSLVKIFALSNMRTSTAVIAGVVALDKVIKEKISKII